MAGSYHVIAPDYPGFGYSDAPSAEAFEYTFDHLADIVDHFLEQKGITKYSIYIQDYGSPVGFRLATRHPERIQAIISQNGNAYEEGLSPFWADVLYPFWKERNPRDRSQSSRLSSPLESHEILNTSGRAQSRKTSAPTRGRTIRPASTVPATAPSNSRLAYDYRTNPPLYPAWHQYLRDHQPPCSPSGARTIRSFSLPEQPPSSDDVPKAEVHLLDTGHFALEEEGVQIASLIADFLDRNVR